LPRKEWTTMENLVAKLILRGRIQICEQDYEQK
jgi:hypothetical protein